jgi:hypothetical protein
MAHGIAGNGHAPADSPLNRQAEFEHSPRSAMNLLEQCRYRVARSVGSATQYVRTHSPADLTGEVERLVRRNPGVALIVAAAAGFLIGKSMNRLRAGGHR